MGNPDANGNSSKGYTFEVDGDKLASIQEAFTGKMEEIGEAMTGLSEELTREVGDNGEGDWQDLGAEAYKGKQTNNLETMQEALDTYKQYSDDVGTAIEDLGTLETKIVMAGAGITSETHLV